MPQRFPVFQFPNPPLIVAMLAAVAGRAAEGRLSQRARVVSRLALLVWSAEEIASGANWFRRALGVAGGAYGAFALRRELASAVETP